MFIPARRETPIGFIYGRCSCKPITFFEKSNKVIIVSNANYEYLGLVGFIDLIDLERQVILVRYDINSVNRIGRRNNYFLSSNIDLFTEHVKIAQ